MAKRELQVIKRMMKRMKIGCLVVLLPLLVACSTETVAVVGKQGKPVRVMQVEEQERPVLLQYTGIIEMDEINHLSFTMSGKIETLYIKEDDYIRRGQLIARLDTKDIDFSIRDAELQIISAQAQYDKALKGASAEEISQAHLNVQKAKDAYMYVKSQQERISSLYEAGALPLQDVDTINFELDLRKNDLAQAEELVKQVEKGADEEELRALVAQVDRANTAYEQKQKLLKDSELRANIDGLVMDVLYKEGEIVGAGAPAFIVRNDQKVVNMGIPQKEREQIVVGMKAVIQVDSQKLTGEVISVDDTPDPRTRLYPVKLIMSTTEDGKVFNDSTVPFGAIATVQFTMEQEQGIWVPINVVIADDLEYVYVIEKNQALRRDVTIEQVTGSEVRIVGIDSSDTLVIEGMKRLTSGDEIVIIP